MMKFTLPLFLLLPINVILGDYCEPSCECKNKPLIAVQCLNANLQVRMIYIFHINDHYLFYRQYLPH